MARNLLLQRVWCPPAASEVRYRQDTLLAAAFAPGGNNDEIFAAAGDGQLLFWKGRELSPVESLFEKPKPKEQEVVQPGFASFSPNAQWLFIIAPTLASAANAEFAGPAPASAGTASRWQRRQPRRSVQIADLAMVAAAKGHTNEPARSWSFSDFQVPA